MEPRSPLPSVSVFGVKTTQSRGKKELSKPVLLERNRMNYVLKAPLKMIRNCVQSTEGGLDDPETLKCGYGDRVEVAGWRPP